MAATSEKSLSEFEKSLEQLEQIVTRMEQGELSLEQSLSAFEEGVRLTRSCQETLREAEQRVSKLIREGGTLDQKPFENPEQD